jgi:hypothetical protein
MGTGWPADLKSRPAKKPRARDRTINNRRPLAFMERPPFLEGMPSALGFDIQSGTVFAEKISPDLIGQPDGSLKPPLVLLAEFHVFSLSP